MSGWWMYRGWVIEAVPSRTGRSHSTWAIVLSDGSMPMHKEFRYLREARAWIDQHRDDPRPTP